MHSRVHNMPFLAYSQSHVTDKLAGSIVSTKGLGMIIYHMIVALSDNVSWEGIEPLVQPRLPS